MALIPPHACSRARARSEIGRLVDLYVTALIAACELRDVKGRYRCAREGRVRNMTGVEDASEIPEAPEIRAEAVDRSAADCSRGVVDELRYGN